MTNRNKFTPFGIQIILEGKSHRVNITHPSFKGRIRKRIGNGNPEKHESLKMHLKVELEKHFQEDDISKDSVSVFVEHYICKREVTMYKKWQIRMYQKQQIRMSIFSI